MKFRIKVWHLLPALLLAATAIGLHSCKNQQNSSIQTERGHDPWVFRSVLDLKPRMITLALKKDFWISYDAGRASLYKVWRDGVLLDGPVYTMAHGPQPTTLGPAWLISPFAEPWRVLANGQESTPAVQYRGHSFDKNGQATLQYELSLADGKVVVVTEKPEFVSDDKGRPGLERIFTVENLPAGTQIGLQVHLNSLPTDKSYETDGEFRAGTATETVAGNGRVFTTEGLLVLKNTGATRFSAWFVNEPSIKPAQTENASNEHPGYALIERSDCKTCHNAEVQTVGPAYKAIAEKYKYTSLNVQQLANKVIAGGTGVWGQVAMMAHPDLQMGDAMEMVQYILSLDGEKMQRSAAMSTPTEALAQSGKGKSEGKGVAVNVFTLAKAPSKLADIKEDKTLVFSGVVSKIHAFGPDFQPLQENFYVEAKGMLEVAAEANYVIRLVSDDGSRLTLDGKELILNDGLHGDVPVDAEIILKAGKHPFKIDYFQAGGGAAISLQWAKYGDEDFQVIPEEALSFDAADLKEVVPMASASELVRRVPGDASPLTSVHPSFDLSQARPSSFKPKVGGLDFLPDGRMVVSTWDSAGSVFVLGNLSQPDPEKITVTRIAAGLAEPLGLKVVDGQIYVLQKQELTQLIDRDGDGLTDEYRTVCNGWRASANFHEFAFGLVYKDGFFYGTLATAINPGGASTQPQIPDRGKLVKINKETGAFEFIASGLRTPNGIGIGVDGEMFIADNQGDWLPSSKILHVKPGAWYGSRSVDFAGTATLKETPPVVWLPQDEIGNSPSQPIYIETGAYKGQMLHGEVTNGGLKRVFAEKVNGQYQGAVFHFSQGLEAGVNRLVWGPDGALYVGGVGNPGNWSHVGKEWYGLQRMKFNGKSTFEMLAVRARSNGLEIEFTEPLQPNDGWEKSDYAIQQFRYQPTINYGGPKLDQKNLVIRSVNVSEDRKKIFLEIEGMKAGHVLYVHLMNHFVSAENHELWTTEAWYNMNEIPQQMPGFVSSGKYEKRVDNQLTAVERAAGWRLLFDGKTFTGWHTYGKQEVGSAWKVEAGTITLAGARDGWQTRGGGDIVTNEDFENFELSLEWKLAPGGNSGIIYHIVEDAKYEYPWLTGPEMQVLDNERHADRNFVKHRAGDLYDLIASRFVAVYPAGQWNKVRLVSNNGKVEQWLNGHKVVEYDMNLPVWNELIKASKFKDMPAFGQSKKGRISLQDHGDPVWYRNIKIRSLGAGA